MEPSQEETGASPGVSRPNLLTGQGAGSSHTSSVKLLDAVESGNDSKLGSPFDTQTPSPKRNRFILAGGIGVLIGVSALAWTWSESSDHESSSAEVAAETRVPPQSQAASAVVLPESTAMASSSTPGSALASTQSDAASASREEGAARVEQMAPADAERSFAAAPLNGDTAPRQPVGAGTTAAALAAGSVAERDTADKSLKQPADADTNPSSKGKASAHGKDPKAKGTASRTASAKTEDKKASGTASIQRSTPVAKKSTSGNNAKSKRSSGEDADADVVAAIMAGLDDDDSGAHKAATRTSKRSTASSSGPSSIAELVGRCNGLPAAKELACRRKICDGYWGKAQACPATMAP